MKVEFARQLNAARIERGWSIRTLAAKIDVPGATVQGWLSGKHFPVAALRPHYLRMVDLLGMANRIPTGLWGDGWDALQPMLREVKAPYLGLQSYGVEDAPLFWGRDAEAARLAKAVLSLREVHGFGIVALVGPSGSGKSSLLAAGLVAGECAKGLLRGWSVDVVEPGLGRAFHEVGADLVVVDQLEDVLLSGAEIRKAAIAGIEVLAKGSVVVVGLRSDAFGEACVEPVLAEALTRPVLLGPLARSELREVITKPAEFAGVSVDPALLRALELDLASGPSDAPVGADVLPLLSTALLVTWAAGSGRQMMLSDYESTGGVAGAVESLAEDVYGALDARQQVAAETLFLRLVRLSGDGVTRQSLALSSLDSDVADVLDAFVAARMLTLSKEEVKISHDVLLRHWGRLARWVEQGRRDLEVVANIRRGAQIWLDSLRDDEALISLQRLPVFSEWLAGGGRMHLLSPLEREYLAACRDKYDSQLAAERRTSIRLRARGRAALGFAGAATALALIAGVSFVQARNSEQIAQGATRDAQSRQVATASRSLREKDLNLVRQMASVSLALADTKEARSAVLDATSADAPLRWVGEPSATLAVLPEAGLVARGSGAGVVSLWRHGELLSTGADFTAGDSAVVAMAARRVDGRDLLSVSGSGYSGLWDVTEMPRRVADLGMSNVSALTFSVDGRLLIAGLATGEVRVVEIGHGGAPRLQEILNPEQGPAESKKAPVLALSATADGRLFVGGVPGRVLCWRLGSGSPALRLPDLVSTYVPTGGTEPAATRTQSLAVSPDGRWLAAGQGGRAVLIWALSGESPGGLRVLRGFGSWVNTVTFDTTSTRLIVGSSDQEVTIFDAESGDIQRRMATPAIVTGVAFLGDVPVATGDDGALRVWSAISPIARGKQPIPSYNLAADPTPVGWLAADNSYGSPHLWRTTDGALLRKPDPVVSLPEGDTMSTGIGLARSGRYLVGASKAGRLISWPLSDAGAGAPTVTETGLGSVATIKVSPNSSLVAAVEDLGSSVGLLRADESGHLTPAGSVPALQASSVDFSYDGQFLIVALGDAGVEVWSITDPERPSMVGRVPAGKGQQKVAASPVSSVIAVGEASGAVGLWDLADPVSPRKVNELSDPAGAIYSVGFSPDGRFLVAAAGDDKTWVWDVPAGATQSVYVLDGDFGRPWDARFIDDGRRITVTGGDGEIKVWAADPSNATRELCQKRGTPLADGEWQRYLPGVRPVDPC